MSSTQYFRNSYIFDLKDRSIVKDALNFLRNVDNLDNLSFDDSIVVGFGKDIINSINLPTDHIIHSEQYVNQRFNYSKGYDLTLWIRANDDEQLYHKSNEIRQNLRYKP